MIFICRITLALILLLSTIFFITSGSQFTISTDLKDLSPELSARADTQAAINKLSHSIEGQFSLIFIANTKDAVADAVKEAKIKLTNIDGIEFNQFESMQSTVEKLKVHRFHLLTPEQKLQLINSETAAIIENARRNLYRMNGSLQVLPITEDPLGIFAEYLASLASKLPNSGNTIQLLHTPVDQLSNSNTSQYSNSNTVTSSNSSTSQFSGKIDQTTYFQALNVVIKEGGMEITAQKILNEQLSEIRQSITSNHSVHIVGSGVFFFAADAAEKSQADIKLISIGSGVGIIVLLLLVFCSAYALIIPLISVATGILFGITMSQLVYGSVHILTIVFGASLIGVIIDYSLHYFYHRNLADRTNKHLRKKLHTAMTISLITSVIGYGALSFSDLDALRKIATFSCFGVFGAWVCVIAIGSLATPVPAKATNLVLSLSISAANKTLGYLSQHFSFSLWVLLLCIFAAYLYIVKIPVNDSPRLFFNPSEDLIAQEKLASKLVSGFEPGQYLIFTGSTATDIYHSFESFQQVLSDQTKPSDLFSVMQLLPSPADQLSNYQLQKQLYEIPGASSAFFTAMGMGSEPAKRLQAEYQDSKAKLLSPEALFNRDSNYPPLWININNTIYSFVLIKKGVNTAALEEASKNFEEILFINTLELTQKALEAQRMSATELLLLAYALIALLLLLSYRSFTIWKILLIPITATTGTLLLFTWFNLDITLFNLMGLFLVLGLGMDYAVFSKEMLDEIAITQNAILLSALTTALSFGLLSVSSIPIAKAFGITLLAGNTINFFASLLYTQLACKNSRYHSSLKP